MDEKKLLDWMYQNFNFDTQKWEYEYIPNEILDCVISIMENNWPHCENEWENDFIEDFICDEIVYWKQWKITKIRLKGLFEEETENLFD